MAQPNPFDDSDDDGPSNPHTNGIQTMSFDHPPPTPLAPTETDRVKSTPLVKHSNGTDPSASPTNRFQPNDAEKRARRRREEAVSRLVADATRPDALDDANVDKDEDGGAMPSRLRRNQQHSTLLLASTVASSIERGLDRELHSELVKQGKEAAEKISKICHDYSEEFLESVGKVVLALGGPCEEVRGSLEEVSVFCFLSWVVCFLL